METKATLTIKELTEHLKIQRSTVNRWMKLGCPYLRTPNGMRRTIRFELDAVLAWLGKGAENGSDSSEHQAALVVAKV